MLQQAFEIDRQGLMLRGTVYRPREGGRFPVAVLLHGFTGNRIEAGFLFVHLARELNRLGIAAVTFDFLHSGESDGSFDQTLVTGELADALRVTQWACAQPFADRTRMGLLGFSLGGLVAACAAKRSGAYRGQVLLAPTTVENIGRFAREKTIDGKVAKGPYFLHERFFEDAATLDPIGDAAGLEAPTLLIRAAEDAAVPAAATQRYIDAMTRAGCPLRVEELAGADHLFNSPAHRARLHALIGGFFADLLQPA
jgi:dienelactone hydrolase